MSRVIHMMSSMLGRSRECVQRGENDAMILRVPLGGTAMINRALNFLVDSRGKVSGVVHIRDSLGRPWDVQNRSSTI